MAYRLRQDNHLGRQLRRIADRQLRRAIGELTAGGDAAMHAARRRVKKVRALLRLVEYRGLNREAPARLREAAALLAPLADTESSMRTFARLGQRAGAPGRQARDVVARMLSENHDRTARDADGVPRTVARLLAASRLDLAHLRVRGRRFDAVAGGLRQGVTRSRRAMRRALRHRDNERFHAWRRRNKVQWFHLRLVARPGSATLEALMRQLEKLDDVLGEHHDVSLITAAIAASSALPRTHTAACLHALRRWQTTLRRRAARLGAAAHAQPPARIARACERSWRDRR